MVINVTNDSPWITKTIGTWKLDFFLISFLQILNVVLNSISPSSNTNQLFWLLNHLQKTFHLLFSHQYRTLFCPFCFCMQFILYISIFLSINNPVLSFYNEIYWHIILVLVCSHAVFQSPYQILNFCMVNPLYLILLC